MCTNIVENAGIEGWGRVSENWTVVKHVSVSFDHPFHSPLEYALNIDFTNATDNGTVRIPIELSPESAETLVKLIQTALVRGKADLARTSPASRAHEPILRT